MDVIVAMNGETIWSRETSGRTPRTFTGAACQNGGVKRQVIAALTEALLQAQGQLGSLDVVDAVVDVGSPPAKIDRHIPISGMGNGNAGGEALEEASIVRMLSTGAVSLKIGVVHKPHIALVAALDDDDIATV
jgi:hypothetical protein